MQPQQTLQHLLQSSPGEPLCDACLAFAMQEPLLTVRRIAQDLSGVAASDFKRDTGLCASCRRQTTTTVFVQVVGDGAMNGAAADSGKCTRCSGRLDADPVTSPTGDRYHRQCWQLVLVDKHLKESRAFARTAREDLRRRRDRVNNE
jgi:hypothetical protein